MAKLLTTRHWGSEESFNCIGKIIKPQEIGINCNDKSVSVSNPIYEKTPLKQARKRKAGNIVCKNGKSKKSVPYSEIFLEPSHVRASALLYEITERTNQLAQPRFRLEEKIAEEQTFKLQIPRASPRIVELSKPRVIYQYPVKPPGYVTPAALTAVATQRIIELSRPKRKRRAKVLNKKRTKQRKERTRYGKYAKKKMDSKSISFGRKVDRKIKGKRKQCLAKRTSSERTVIMVGMNLKDGKKNHRY